MLNSTVIPQLQEQWAKSTLSNLSTIELIVSFTSFLLLCFVLRAVYLLFFHPLAAFPGPYQAALSTWWLYGVTKSGQPAEVFERLHKRYNTRALRIAPNELHINDPELYNTIYSQRYTFTKEPYFYGAFNTPHSVFVETEKDAHRVRRKMLSGFFSKQTIRSMEGTLGSRVKTLCNQLSGMKGDGAINLYHALRCLTVDFISEVAFGESFNLLNKAQRNTFNAPFLEAFDLAADSIWEFMYFPILRTVVNNLPPPVTKLNPAAANFLSLFTAVGDTVKNFRRRKSSGKSLDKEVVFDSMAHLDDKTLSAEAVDILVAGSDTTATTLTTAISEMINKPAIWKRLKEEVKGPRVDKDKLHSLEQLPFLTACVKEAMRYAIAVPGRLPRIVPDGTDPFIVDGQVVPPGSSVGMSAWTMHFDPNIWGDDARSFNPDRWLANGAKDLDKYIVTFSKGTRACLGINLAYAEATLALAMLAERFTFTRDETMTKADLSQRDNFTMAFVGSGLRVVVHEDKS